MSFFDELGGGGGSSMGGGAAGVNWSNPDEVLQYGAARYIQQDLAKNIGLPLLAFLFDLTLFGIFLHQLVVFLAAFKTDRMFIKTIVGYTTVITIVTTVWTFYCLWSFFVEGFGQFGPWIEFDQVTWYAIFGIITTVGVHVFYIERAYRLWRQALWVPLSLVLPIIAYCVGAIGAKVITTKGSNNIIVYSLKPWFHTWLSALFVTDLMLTVMITVGLYKSRTGFSNTDRVVTRLIRITFEAQFPATCFAIAYLVYYCFNPVSLVMAAFEIAHVKIYSVSMMAVLNARISLRKEISTDKSGWSSSNRSGSDKYQQETMEMPKISRGTDHTISLPPHIPPDMEYAQHRPLNVRISWFGQRAGEGSSYSRDQVDGPTHAV